MSCLKLLTPLIMLASLTACDCFRDSYDGHDRRRMDSRERSEYRDSQRYNRPGSTMGAGGYSGPSAATRHQTGQSYPGGPADTGPKGPVRDMPGQ